MRPALREVRRGWPSGTSWTRPGGSLQSGGKSQQGWVPTRAHTRHDTGSLSVRRDPGRSRAAFWGSRAKQPGLSVPIMSYGAGRVCKDHARGPEWAGGPGVGHHSPCEVGTACAGQGAAGRAPSDGWSQHPHGAPGTTAGSPCAWSPPQAPTRCPPGPGVPPWAGIMHPQRLQALLGTHTVCCLTRAARIRSHPARAAVRRSRRKGSRKTPPRTRGGLQNSPAAPEGPGTPARHSLSSPASPAQECRWIKIPTASVIGPARL